MAEDRVVAALGPLLAGLDGKAKLLLETCAGQGATIGRSFEELGRIIKRLEGHPRLGVCLDTCHVFAAGYDISTDRGYDETFKKFDEVLGIERLRAFHLNDSMKPLGARVDRHEQVCKGEIGPLCFRRLVNDSRFRNVPGYLEIPPEGNRSCLLRLKRLREGARQGKGRPRVASGVRPG